MRLYSGLLPSAAPAETRIFTEIEGKLIDLRLAYAACLAESGRANAYELAAYCFPSTLENFFERGKASLDALEIAVATAYRRGVDDFCGPAREKITYVSREIRLLPPLRSPERSFVIGFSDRARTEALPKAEVPTGFYKLPQTFVTDGAPIVWPKFAQELDADACLAIVIGKAGRRIEASSAWEHIAGVSLLIDITARDVNRREGLTTNNLLGKNFPSSTSLGPAVLVRPDRKSLESLEVELAIDGESNQRFSLGRCVFTVEQIVAHWSTIGLKPGDFLAVGASMACGDARLQNPAPLKIGAKLRCASPALGELSHTVVAAGGRRS